MVKKSEQRVNVKKMGHVVIATMFILHGWRDGVTRKNNLNDNHNASCMVNVLIRYGK